jgi:CDP-diacylglycerol--glycerol-3-phosphate 3-phosphatidyltransferase
VSSFRQKYLTNIWNVPNVLTMIRLALIPVFVVLHAMYLEKLALLTFCVASFTDWLDGHIARKNNLITTFGKFMDPLADKLLVCSAMICLVDLGRIESWIVIIIIAREFIISGFRLIAVEKGTVIAANYWGKFKTVTQMVMVILMVANLGGVFNTIAQVVKWLALAMTVISLCTYLFENRTVLDEER